MIDSFDREEFSRLQQKFSNRDIETELIYVANYIKPGWMTKADAEFFKWLAMAVLNKGVETACLLSK